LKIMNHFRFYKGKIINRSAGAYHNKFPLWRVCNKITEKHMLKLIEHSNVSCSGGYYSEFFRCQSCHKETCLW
jgi:hypothetical protein